MNQLTFYQTLRLPLILYLKLVAQSRARSSLPKNSHRQIVFEKFYLRIEYPPPYERLVWNYKQANTLFIQRAISKFNWKNASLIIEFDKNFRFLMKKF